MAGKATAVAPANIAFIKYWGVRTLDPLTPANPSISMTLRRCQTRTTVEHRQDRGPDEVLLRTEDGRLSPPPESFVEPVRRHVERIRSAAGCGGSFRVATENSFPAAAGLASSASGFTALSLAATRALGLALAPGELSRLACRSGSGSAARSALGGFVEWPAGEGDEELHAIELAPAEHWELRDVIALVDVGTKPVASVEGHRLARTSPYFQTRLGRLGARLGAVRQAIARRSLDDLGPVLEEEAIDLHLIAMSSRPPIFYWRPATLEVLDEVRRLRNGGLSAWATMDAGPNVHVICAPDAATRVAQRLADLPGVMSVIHDGVGQGPRVVSEHLF